MPEKSYRPRRAVLFVPASNEKAIAKLPSLACDAVIFDLEDAVAPEAKMSARERLKAWFAARPKDGPECVIRINPLASEWGADDRGRCMRLRAGRGAAAQGEHAARHP